MTVNEHAVAWSEEQRLAALASYRILDTPPEPEFDDIVRLASKLCETPIAAISLVADGRQWFKAAVGLELRETSLVVAVCDDAIRLHGLFEVPDLSLDPRFRESALVQGPPHLRFYAGAPLLTPTGLPLGMLCVLDTQARRLTEGQREGLQALARQVMAQIELRRLLLERDEVLSQKDLLVRELHHRVKNTLTTVQSVMNSTVRATTTVPEFQQAFAGRVSSLAKTHALLTEHDWQAVSFRDLLWAELGPFDNGSARRILLEGPAVTLPSDLAIPIGMAVHELTSNAAKYGALADPEGSIVVRWQAVRRDGRPHLAFEWSEHDGPPVALPTREGFGSRLLRRVLTQQVNAEVAVDYAADGLRVAVTLPLAS
jgi:two-component sensor histidine kinase